MKCHYVYDKIAGKVLIPGCWSVVHSNDIEDCTCGYGDGEMTFAQFERERYNEEINKRNSIIKDLREEVEYLHKELERHVDLLSKKYMKAISIKQPWASLIVHGIKDIENRTWPCPKKYIGQRVLIHASAKNDGFARFSKEQQEAKSHLTDAVIYESKSAIIGSVQIVDCTFNHPSIWAEQSKGVSPGGHVIDEKEPIIYNWVLANPILFKEPMPAKGKLSFWDYPNIHSEDGICLCQIAVDEKNQVMNLCGEYRCWYCGGKWYK